MVDGSLARSARVGAQSGGNTASLLRTIYSKPSEGSEPGAAGVDELFLDAFVGAESCGLRQRAEASLQFADSSDGGL